MLTIFRKCENGLNRLGVLFFLLFVLVVGFTSWQIIPFYYYYYELIGTMESQADKASVFTDREIREVLNIKIRKLEIPIEDKDDLKIHRFNNKIIIELEYEEVFYVDLGEDRVYDIHVFKFNPRVERPL